MRIVFVAIAMLAGLTPARAADVAAGKAKAEAVCAACHGANGVSVGAAIPNLAGQKVAYLSAQLKAFKASTRKNPMMNAIAAQLAAKDIDDVAAFFASLAGPQAGAKSSEFLPHIAKTNVKFPENYKATFTKYMTIDFPDRNQVRYYYANPVALAAAGAGKTVPDGAVLFVEVHSVKLDDQKKPLKGADGHFVPDKLAFYTAMARDAGWGREIPAMLRNEDWNYAVFNLDKSVRTGANQAECLACHKPLDKESYLFTLKELRQAAAKK